MAEPVARSTIPFVGRNTELELLRRYLQSCIQQRVPTFVLVQGDFGVGKTSLVTHFLAEVAEHQAGVLVAQSRCAAQTELSGLVPFSQLLAGFTEPTFLDRAGVGNLLEFFREVAPAWLDVVTSGAVGAVIKTVNAGKKLVARPTYSQDSVFVQFTSAVTALAQRGPVVGFIDDLHWADASSLRLLFHLARNLEAQPVLIICSYRPVEGRETGPNAELFRSIEANLVRYGARELELERGIDVGEYVSRRYPHNSMPALFVNEIQNLTDGHALYVSQLFSLWEELGKIVCEPAGDGSPVWRLIEPADASQVALSSVTKVLEERVHLIQEELREILSCASVEGEDFTAQVIARVRQLDEYVVCGSLETLDHRYHLVEEQQAEVAQLAVLDFYSFVHRFFRDYMYGQLSASKRRILHRRVGECLEALYSDCRQIAGQLALHFREAQQPLKAVQYARMAVEYEQTRFAWPEAEGWCQFGLAVLERLPTGQEANLQRLDFLVESAQGYYHRGAYPAAEERYHQALELASELGVNPERTAGLYKRLADVKEYEGRYDEALAFLERGRQVLVESSAPYGPTHAALDALDGFLQTRLGGDATAVRVLQAALARAEGLPRTPELTDAQADALNSLGIALGHLGHYSEAVAAYRDSLRVNAETRDTSFEAVGYLNLAQCYLRMGMLGESRACMAKGLENSTRTGHQAHQAYARFLKGLILLETRTPREAAEELEQAIALAERVGAGWYRATMLSHFALAHMALSNLDLAADQARRAVAIAQEDGNPGRLGFGLDALAQVEAARQEWSPAAEHFGQALAILEAANYRHSLARAQRHYAEMLLRLGELERSCALLQLALSTFRELGLDHEIAETQSLLEVSSSSDGPAPATA